MKDRCTNPRVASSPDYGGRGITICPRWLGPDGFQNFANDMGLRPRGKTLDRINPNGNYEPASVRWATSKVQANNKRSHWAARIAKEIDRRTADRIGAILAGPTSRPKAARLLNQAATQPGIPPVAKPFGADLVPLGLFLLSYSRHTYRPAMLRFLEILHLIVFLVGLVGIIFGLVAVGRGIAPVLWRLGNGLANRKIAVFAKGENLPSLKNLLLDSKLMSGKNILEVTSPGDIGRASAATVYIVFWPDWAHDIDAILDQKPDSCALIVYSPYDLEGIAPAQMKKLDGKRHTAVTNFRGRLLNDIITSMITTTE